MAQTFAIYEGNMERLVKKLTRIQNKCRKYGCDFYFSEVGEEFRERTDEYGETYTVRYVIVEAEGQAIINGWRFVASVEHTEKGNVISRACDIEVPERYYNSDPVCEHCHSNRVRKDTFIVLNEETGEFKQVGRNCLCDYTHGMKAEGVAQYVAAFDELIAEEAIEPGFRCPRFIQKDTYLRYVAETIRHFGYTKRSFNDCSTADRAGDYYGIDFGWRFPSVVEEQLKKEMADCGFNADSAESGEMVKAALAWLNTQDESNNYMHNLKTVCALQYVTTSHFGLLASLFPTFDRELERQEEQRKRYEAEKSSEWVGEIGKRIDFAVSAVKLATSWETMYGTTYIWKITDTDGNVFTWKTSNWVDVDEVKTVKGTVKDHNEFRGIKQTELTRCKCAA